MSLFESLFGSLNDTGVRYVVGGGVAMVLHGYARFTADVDLIVDLEPARARTLVAALVQLGFVPRAPVDALDFADSAIRQRWIAERSSSVCSRGARMTAEAKAPRDDAWPVSWVANRAILRESTAAATPAQRLAWLEAALRLAHRAGALSHSSGGAAPKLEGRSNA